MNSSALTDTYNLTVTDNPSLTVTLNPGTPISLNPTAEGVFGSQDVGVNVMTTDDKGYTLTMSAATSSLSRSTADSSAPVIETLASATAQNDFPNNRWGFKRTSTKYTDTNFQPMLANYNVPISSNGDITGSSGETSTLTFGVKLNTDIPSGEYSIAINFLAVNNVAPNLYYMQDATPSSLAAAMPSVGDTTVLYDRRDNKEYTIAKLADGKYWMTKNLDLNGGTPLYSSDSDVPAGYDVEPYYTLPASQKITSGTTLDGGFNDDAGAYVFNSGNTTCNSSIPCYSYYSWNAAVAGNKTNVNADVTEGDVDADAPYSICPAGWKLPTSRHDLTTAKTSSDFYQMAIHYGMNPANVNEDPDNDGMNFCTLGGDCGTNTVPRFLRAGGYYGSTFGNGGAHGLYWSSTASSGAYAYALDFYSGLVYSAYNRYRRYGFPVRCLFDDTMQSFSSDYASALAMEESVQLRDKRDNKQYWVTKLKDGNVWMTQNLDFDITGDTLSSTTTNLVTYGSEPYTSDKGYSQDSATGEITWTPISTGATIITGRDETGPNGEINYGTNAGKWANSNNAPYSVDPGEWYQSGTYFTSSVCNDAGWSTGCNFLNSAKNTAQDGVTALTNYFRQTPYEDNGTHGAIGNWYNWSAAVAANDTSAITSGTLTNSVCPAGWGLPANGKYGTINTNYNSNAASGALDAGLFAAPLYFVRGGYIYTGGATTLYDAGRYGHYWSGTTYSADVSYSLDFRSSYVIPADGSSRGVGDSVRCLLRTE